ncbi:MAG: MogA/MoaB family molybdenum cofactor biosynthesis protein [Deltaproteobacteria bacterium]|nr:MogA/MoaB family molybdenum cofactor biosynthesis protein [Deltaproteobacteria bacterium]
MINACAVLTISDRGFAGEREDASGKEVTRILTDSGFAVIHQEIIPDEVALIAKTLVMLADEKHLPLIVTTGGTGVSPRDVTPEATLSIIEKQIPGMAEAMRLASMQKTPHAMISRAVVGIRGITLIVNLPGSPRAARENLAVIMPALPHAIAKIQGDSSDCAS